MKSGAKIVHKALKESIRQIVINAGVYGSVIIKLIKDNRKTIFGFDVNFEGYTYTLGVAIVNPSKVVWST